VALSLLACYSCAPSRSEPGKVPRTQPPDIGASRPDVVVRFIARATSDDISEVVGLIADPTVGPPPFSYSVDYDAKEVLLEWYNKARIDSDLVSLRKRLMPIPLLASIDKI
jgi:hypothetical protein